MSFANKVVIVTGASSGIGAATALQFANEGAHVALVGRNEAKLRKVTAQCEEIGIEPLAIVADISKEDQAASVIDKTIDKFGKVDILVNNAGILRIGTIIKGTILSSFDEVINTNLRAVIHLTTLATPHLINSKGNIVNVSSAVGVKLTTATPLLAYSMMKTALNVFGEGAAIELARHGVRVNTVSPGPVHTDILENANFPVDALKDTDTLGTALNRVSQPEEIADLILYLASDKAVGITGSNFLSDNGMNLT